MILKKFPEYGRKPADTPPFLDTLRRVIIGRIHAGSLQPGDRLPSVREVAERSGVDHRVAASAYRVLEKEGLVEVRPKSGVFVAPSLGRPADTDESAAWAANILFEAWRKGIGRSSLCGLLGGMLPSPLRCGCIESNEDHLVALAGEIEEGLSLELVPMLVDPSVEEGAAPPDDIAEVDVIVTSVFHARYARAVGAAAGKPVAVLNLCPEYVAEIGSRLGGGPVTVVIADPKYAGRGKEFFAALGKRLDARFVTVGEALEEKLDYSSDSVLVTRAVRRRLGLEDYHLVPSLSVVSEESMRALCEIVAAAAPKRRQRLKLDDAAVGRSARAPSPTRTHRPPRAEPPVEAVVEEVERAIRKEGVFEALRVLNASTPHRFTAIYRFEPGWVRSFLLYDRENPQLRVGPDVPMRESYCVIVGDSGEDFCIENALHDPRLTGHKAQGAVLSYCAVHLTDAHGRSWGTLCHYDFRPSEIAEETLAVLKAVRPAIQATLGPATAYAPQLPECPAGRPALADAPRRKPARTQRAVEHPEHAASRR